jgi:succinate-semialdehyde dehydrogenase / glutarate-semialdehyde dehydrogenase
VSGVTTTTISEELGVTPNTVLINGEWTDGGGGARFDVQDPSTGAVIGQAVDAGAQGAKAAIAAATAAFPGWSATTAYQRSEILYRAHALMLERSEDLARLMTLEQGKPLRAARTEVRYAADFLIWFAEEAKRMYGRTIPSSREDQRFVVMHQAVGVVGAITPWNYPISMITRKVGPALAAGCTVVLKPAPQTPLCAVATAQVLVDAGLPAGVVNVVTALDPTPVGDEFLANPDVRKLTFTGSTRVGKLLARGAADQMKRVSMELGGHAPFIVLPDADPVHAAKGAAMVKLLNTGQACISPNRIYVHSSIRDEFVAALGKRVASMRVGNGFADGVSVGPLIDESARERMERQVRDAVDKGATVAVGGERLTGPDHAAGFFYAPTVLTDVTPEMDIYRNETFGPLAPVITFDDESEVIRMANDTTYGLASYIYTNNLSGAWRLAEGLRFGMVGINDINPTSAAAPFGGVNQSGLGREGASEGLLEYLDLKLVGISV